MNPRHRPVIGLLLGVAAGVLVALVLTLLVRTWSVTDAIRESQLQNTQARKSSDKTLQAIEDCTQPQGDCYKRGQQQTAGAVSDINRVVILAAACATGLSPDLSVMQRQVAIQGCVVDRLARQNP